MKPLGLRASDPWDQQWSRACSRIVGLGEPTSWPIRGHHSTGSTVIARKVEGVEGLMPAPSSPRIEKQWVAPDDRLSRAAYNESSAGGNRCACGLAGWHRIRLAGRRGLNNFSFSTEKPPIGPLKTSGTDGGLQ